MNYEEKEVGNHRKRKKKTVKKSDHKHVYSLISEEYVLKSTRGSSLVNQVFKCSICDKVVEELKFKNMGV